MYRSSFSQFYYPLSFSFTSHAKHHTYTIHTHNTIYVPLTRIIFFVMMITSSPFACLLPLVLPCLSAPLSFSLRLFICLRCVCFLFYSPCILHLFFSVLGRAILLSFCHLEPFFVFVLFVHVHSVVSTNLAPDHFVSVSVSIRTPIIESAQRDSIQFNLIRCSIMQSGKNV